MHRHRQPDDKQLIVWEHGVYVAWRWRNFLNFTSCSGGHDVGQWNVHILQHLQSDRWDDTFYEPIDSMLFKWRDKSQPVNFSKYDNLPYNIDIVDYCDVSSFCLHAVLI